MFRWRVWLVVLLCSTGFLFLSHCTPVAPSENPPSEQSRRECLKEGGCSASDSGVDTEFSDASEPTPERLPEPVPEPQKQSLRLGTPTIIEPAKDFGTLRIQPAVGISGNGEIGVAFTSRSNVDSKQLGIYFQLVDKEGKDKGKPVALNTLSGGHNEPSLCALKNGGFVAAWSSDDKKSSDDNLHIYFRLIKADGSLVGDKEVEVDTGTKGNHWLAKVACAPKGGFTVAGVMPDSDGKTFGVFVQSFDATGKVVGKFVKANVVAEGSQVYPQVSVAADGTRIVVWEDTRKDGGQELSTSRFRLLPAAGNPSGVLIAHGDSTRPAARPNVAISPDSGNFVIATVLSGRSIRVSFYKADNPDKAASSPDMPASGTSRFVNPILTALPVKDRFGILFFRSYGTSNTLKLGLLSPDKLLDTPVDVADGKLPPYQPHLAASNNKVVVAWTERGQKSGTYTFKLALYPLEKP